MPVTQVLTDEQAAAIWSGDTASILGYDQQATSDTSVTPPADNATQDPPPGNPVSDEDINNIWRTDGNIEDDEDDEEEDKDNPVATQATPNPKPDNQAAAPSTTDETKRGRKPSDLVSLVNQLVSEKVLDGYEDPNDPNGIAEIKTIEEAKELIKENLKYKEEVSEDVVWKKKVESYSPQVQAILHYAEKGGKDITPLLNAISEVEKSSDLNIDEEAGQEEVVRQVLKIKGFDDEEIKDQLETLKDLDKLKAKATKFLPELNKMKQQRIQMIMEEEEQRNLEAKEAAEVYIQTLQQTLDKDQVGQLKLKREDKYKLIEALAVPKYRSLNGHSINEFIKKLEDMQFGKNADYEHFLNLVHFAIDKDGFTQKFKEAVKTEVTTDTIKRLKTAKNASANTSQDLNTDTSRKNFIQRGGFKNPYAK